MALRLARGRFAGAKSLRSYITLPYSDTKSVIFDGSPKYVDMGNVYAYERTDSFSFSFWTKGVASDQIYIFKGGDVVDWRGYVIRKTGSSIVVNFAHEYYNDDFYRTFFGGTTLEDGSWHHVVVTYSGTSDANGVTVYLDGVSQGVKGTLRNALTDTIVDANSFVLGKFITPQYNVGTMDEVAVYNKVLSGAEVTWIYNSGHPRDLTAAGCPTGLQSWWRMGDLDTYPTLQDRGTGGHNGTMTNMDAGDIVTDAP